MARGVPADGERRRLADHRAHRGRDRHRQGAGRARASTATSARADGPFLAVNCAALPETLLESELFGHRRGRLHRRHAGPARALRGGRAAARSSSTRSARCRRRCRRSCCACSQEGEVVPVGDTRPRKVDVRVISATNRDLAAEVADAPLPRGPLLPARRLPDPPARRCASAARTSRCSPSASSRPRPSGTTSASPASSPRRSSAWRATTGRATCASCRTRSSAPSRSRATASRSALAHLSAKLAAHRGDVPTDAADGVRARGGERRHRSLRARAGLRGPLHRRGAPPAGRQRLARRPGARPLARHAAAEDEGLRAPLTLVRTPPAGDPRGCVQGAAPDAPFLVLQRAFPRIGAVCRRRDAPRHGVCLCPLAGGDVDVRVPARPWPRPPAGPFGDRLRGRPDGDRRFLARESRRSRS